MEIPITPTNWNKTYRLISTRVPPIDLFERVIDKNLWQDIGNYEAASNPRVRNILFRQEDSVFGPGSSYVMAPFYYNFPPGRFTTAQFGGYYAAKEPVTAIYEKSHHIGLLYRDSREEPGLMTPAQMLVGKINAQLHDVTNIDKTSNIYAANSYNDSQELAASLYEKKADGIVYNSVRHQAGLCFVAYKPKLLAPPTQGAKPVLHWDGSKIDRWFDGKWHEVQYATL